MKIDAHQHFWHYSPTTHAWINDEMQVLKQSFLPENLASVLNKKGFDGCVAVQASQTEAENDFLLGLAEQNEFIKGVVGWLDLRATNIEDRLVHYQQNTKFCGIRHVVQDEPDDDFLLRADFQQGISKLKAFGLTYDVLVFERQLPAAVKFVEAFPDQPFVLDHIAKPLIAQRKLSPWEENVKQLAQCDNVYCKVSGMVTEADWKNWQYEDFKLYLDVVFEAFGAERIMIGSDWPVCLLATDYNKVIDIVEKYIQGFSEAEKKAIMGENAVKFYNLMDLS
ncbi:MAG: amidohydrolase family protein [Bacteroidota bacterium]